MKIKSNTRPMLGAPQAVPSASETDTKTKDFPGTPTSAIWQEQPLPDVSDFRPEPAKLGEAPRLSPLQVQMGQRGGADGAAFLAGQLEWIREKTARGEAVMVVFDLDNTLFDTRARTLQAAKTFDAFHASNWFAELTLDDVQLNGEQTARGMRNPALPEEVVEAFAKFWGQAFWTPENLRHDLDMPETLSWAKAAQAAGADVRYLTGRTAPFYDATIEQLRRTGLRVESSQLCCKPDVDVATAPFKTEILKTWSETAPIAWFMTEGLRDLSHVQNEMPSLPTVCLECSFEDKSAHRISSDTPRLPAHF